MILKITAKHLLSKPFSSFMTLVALSAALTLLGTFWTVVENLERVRFQQKNTAVTEQGPGLTVFVDSKLGKNEVETLKQKILQDTRLQSVDTVSPAEAMRALEQQFGETLSKAFGDDSLPLTLRVRFSKSSINRQDLVTMLNSLRSLPGVLDVDDGMAVTPVAESPMANRIFSWANGLLIAVFLVVALLVSHLIRLAFESLRQEIETMKIVGAPSSWILMPLVADGLVMGVAGAIVSLGALMTFVEFVLPRFSHVLMPKGVAVSGLSLPSTLSLMALSVGASLVGAISTWPLVKRPPQEV